MGRKYRNAAIAAATTTAATGTRIFQSVAALFGWTAESLMAEADGAGAGAGAGVEDADMREDEPEPGC